MFPAANQGHITRKFARESGYPEVVEELEYAEKEEEKVMENARGLRTPSSFSSARSRVGDERVVFSAAGRFAQVLVANANDECKRGDAVCTTTRIPTY